MKKFALLFVVALSLFGEQVHRPASEFVIQSPGGKQTLLSSYKGKTIVLALMFTTCTHCQKTAGVLADVQREYADKGVQVLGATFDNGAALRVADFNRVFKLNYPCGYSNDKAVLEFLHHPASEPYFVPILVFIDKKFNVRSQYVGDETFLNNQEANIRKELDSLLK